jgi:hypothetical protein
LLNLFVEFRRIINSIAALFMIVYLVMLGMEMNIASSFKISQVVAYFSSKARMHNIVFQTLRQTIVHDDAVRSVQTLVNFEVQLCVLSVSVIGMQFL